MVRILIAPKTCRRLHARLVTIMAVVITTGIAAETSITLNQGANIAVTAPAAFNRMAFDLAGQIWLTGDANEPPLH